MEPILFDDYPWPPSENKMYAHVSHKRQRGRSIRIETRDLKKFKEDVWIWTQKNRSSVTDARMALKLDLIQRDSLVGVDAYFGLPATSMWLLNGSLRRVDCSNWIKALHDSLSSVLGIDDKYFTIGRVEKYFATSDKRKLTVCIQTHRIRNQDEVWSELNGKTKKKS